MARTALIAVLLAIVASACLAEESPVVVEEIESAEQQEAEPGEGVEVDSRQGFSSGRRYHSSGHYNRRPSHSSLGYNNNINAGYGLHRPQTGYNSASLGYNNNRYPAYNNLNTGYNNRYPAGGYSAVNNAGGYNAVNNAGGYNAVNNPGYNAVSNPGYNTVNAGYNNRYSSGYNTYGNVNGLAGLNAGFAAGLQSGLGAPISPAPLPLGAGLQGSLGLNLRSADDAGQESAPVAEQSESAAAADAVVFN